MAMSGVDAAWRGGNLPAGLQGEEFNRAARLFTHGYDLYSPNVNFVYHWYPSEEKPPHLRSPAVNCML